MNNDIFSIIAKEKANFTRDRKSVINEFLEKHNDVVVLSYIKKTRGDSIKLYYIKDGKKCTNEYVVKNAKILINAFIKNNIKLYQHNNGKITQYQDE